MKQELLQTELMKSQENSSQPHGLNLEIDNDFVNAFVLVTVSQDLILT